MLAFRELGIGIVTYSPLGRGFFAGRAAVERVPSESLLVNEIYTIVIIFYSNVIVRLCCVCVWIMVFKTVWRDKGLDRRLDA